VFDILACGFLLFVYAGVDPEGGHGAMPLPSNTIERFFNERTLFNSFHSYFGIHLLFI